MKKNITLIGCGRWGLNILRDLLQLDCNVIVIDPKRKAQENAQHQGAFQVHSSLEEFFKEKTYTDGFIIAASTLQHYSLLILLKAVNQPIFVEKPMVLNTSETKHVMSLMSDRVFVMHKWRYHPAVLELKKLINHSKLGKVKKISTIRHGLQFKYDIPGYRILLPHDLSIILELVGSIPAPIDVQKYIYDEEMIGLRANFDFNPHIDFSIKSKTSEWRREISVEFEHGTALFTEQDNQAVFIFDLVGKLSETIIFENIQPLYQELKTFLSYIDGGPEPKSCLEDEFKIANCTEQLIQLAFNNEVTVCQ